MLFVNYETMPGNVVIGFMIIFGIIFCSNYRISTCFICKNHDSISTSVVGLSGRRRFITGLSGQEPINGSYRSINRFPTLLNLKLGQFWFQSVSTNFRRFIGGRSAFFFCHTTGLVNINAYSGRIQHFLFSFFTISPNSNIQSLNQFRYFI
jgi:hypothetical protein